jgi:uncharacterized protein YjiS (DUF1127 family)
MRPSYFDFERYRARGPYRRHDECSPCRAVVELARAGLALALEWRKRVRERHELARLDHAMQRDIGITPTEIAREIGKPFWRA